MDRKPRALMLASVASMIGQFNMHNIRLLLDAGFRVDVAANFKAGNTVSKHGIEEIRWQLAQMGVEICHIPVPRDISCVKDIFATYRRVECLCRKNHYQVIHCNSPIGGVVARYSARHFRKMGTKVIYTAHGFHFYKGAPFKNWLLFYPAEWLCSWWTDVLVTINQEDYRLARKHLHAGKACYVPGVGIDMEKFCPGQGGTRQERNALGVSDSNIMLLSVGELNANKNHQAAIRAIEEFGNPNIRYFICGIGALEKELNDLIRNLGLEKQVTLLGYRTDIPQLCQAADLFVFPSKREGLPVALMEAIACKTPVICSDIRGNRELVKDAGCMFDAADTESLVMCLRGKIGNRTRQEFLESMEGVVTDNYRHLKKHSLEHVKERMRDIYLQ